MLIAKFKMTKLMVLQLLVMVATVIPWGETETLSIQALYNDTVVVSFQPYNKTWSRYKIDQGKQYGPEENEFRFQIFLESVKKIEHHNQLYVAGKTTFYMGLNKFTDMTTQERRQYFGFMGINQTKKASGRPMPDTCYVFKPSGKSQLPLSVDWRNRGFVTPVKDQANCGSCWAFSATGALEGQVFRKTGRLISLSEQQLMDCSRNYSNSGCEGGRIEWAFQYIHGAGGVEPEKLYPYEAKDDTCHFSRRLPLVHCRGCVAVIGKSERGLQAAVAEVGPISVYMQTTDLFMAYTGDIFDDPFCDASDDLHAVLVVGYGSKNGKDYWIVKNSYGQDWGVNGYVYMSRNNRNQCNIATEPYFPLV